MCFTHLRKKLFNKSMHSMVNPLPPCLPRECGDPGINDPTKWSILPMTLEEKNGPLRGNYLSLDPRIREEDSWGEIIQNGGV